MKRLYFSIFILLFFSGVVFGQNIPENLSYYRIYDFLDELATDGVIDVNSAIKPYNRNVIASALKEAKSKDSLLHKRQIADLDFFMSEFAQELDTMPKAYVHWSSPILLTE